jgi:hypothetical protein
MEMILVDPGQRYVIMCRVFGTSLGRKMRMLIVLTAGRNGPESLAMVLLH